MKANVLQRRKEKAIYCVLVCIAAYMLSFVLCLGVYDSF